MELIAFIISLLALVTIFMPWVNFFRYGGLRDDIEILRSRIKELEYKAYEQQNAAPAQEQTTPAEPEPETEPEPQPETTVAAPEPPPVIAEPEPAPSHIPYVAKTIEKTDIKASFEQHIATKLPVWIGSISLILAAFFLVKYSIEFGWLGPLGRVILGGLFGGGLLAAGQYISARPKISNAVQISQGLIGAGLVALYVSLYAAINLYELIGPLSGFGGMCLVTAMAVILSLRHGQPIAVFGLIGGLLTPALVSTTEPNTIALFSYLFLLFASLSTVLIRKGWWTLAVITLIGMFMWSAAWMAFLFTASEAFILIIFALAMTTVVLAGTGKRIAEDTLEDNEKTTVHILNTAAISGGAITVLWVSLKITISLFDWSMLGLFSLALIALTYFKQDVYEKPLYVKLAAVLSLFYVWAADAPLLDALTVIAGIAAVYIGAASILMRKVADPRFWALVQCSTALALYLISYAVLDLPAWWMESFAMFWGILSLVLASFAAYQATDIQSKYRADNTIRQHLVTIYCLTASAFISLGLAIEMPWAYMPLAFAGQIAATAWAYKRTDISCLKYIMYVLTLIFIGLNYEQLLLFSSVILSSLVGETPSRSYYSRFILENPLVNLGIPSVLLYASLWFTMQRDKADKKLIHALFGTASVLILFTAYYLFRAYFHTGSGHIFASEIGFIERGIVTITLGLVGIGAMEFVRKHDIEFLKPWGQGIFRMAITRLVYFDLFLHNPYFADSQFVGDMPLINGVTMTYGFGLAFCGWALYRRDMMTSGEFAKKFFSALSLSCLFALTSFNVAQFFNGGFIEADHMSSAELYAYSVVWLLTGIGLLAAGIKTDDKPTRMAALGFLTLAVCKVFLLDAAGLEGLFRVASFLGLGISLIGLSYFYTRFISDKDKSTA